MYFNSLFLHTLQVQIFGSWGCLRGDLGINLDHVEVVGVPGDDDIVPVVVVEGLVGVAFDQVGSISQVRHIVQVTGNRYLTAWVDATMDRNVRHDSLWKRLFPESQNINKCVGIQFIFRMFTHRTDKMHKNITRLIQSEKVNWKVHEETKTGARESLLLLVLWVQWCRYESIRKCSCLRSFSIIGRLEN